MFHFRHKTMAEILYCVSRTGILIKVSVSSTQLYIKFWLLGHEFMAISLKKTVISFSKYTTEWIFKKRGYEGDDFLFRTVIKSVQSNFLSFFTLLQANFHMEGFPTIPCFQLNLNFCSTLFY